MRIFVTGGTGFLGSHLVDTLRAQDHSVTVLSRQRSGAVSEGLTYVNELPSSLEAYDFVYHVAGVLGSPKIPYNQYYQAHVELPRKLTSMIVSQPLVFVSTAYVLSRPAPSHPEYVATKLMGESIIPTSLNTMIVRPGFIYGPRDMHHYPLFKWISRLGRYFPIVGSGNNLVCPTYVQDVVANILPETHCRGARVIAGAPIPMNILIASIAYALDVSRPRLHIPPIVKSDFFTTERVFYSSVETTSLSKGLKLTVDWYKSEGLV